MPNGNSCNLTAVLPDTGLSTIRLDSFLCGLGGTHYKAPISATTASWFLSLLVSTPFHSFGTVRLYAMRVTVLVSALLTFSSSALATCYFPNGQISPADTACDPSAIESSCCYKNQACLSNGLCVSDPHNPELARLHRGTCTDQSWKSGNCVRSSLGMSNAFCCICAY